MIIKKSTYEKMLRKIEQLEAEIKPLIALREEECSMRKNKIHEVSPLCKGCRNCVETGVGYFGDGTPITTKYECRLNQPCDDFLEDAKT